MLADPHYNARGMFEEVQVAGETLQIPAMVPRLSETPGRTDWAGPEVGQHNQEVLGGILGISEAEMAEMADKGII